MMQCIDFIGVWKQKVPDEFCDEIIDYINSVQLQPQIGSNTTIRQDYSCHLFPGDFGETNDPDGKKEYFFNKINSYLQPCMEEYVYFFSALQGSQYFNAEIKLQKTEPCQGYHVWHCENVGPQFMQRGLVWSIYLNSIPDNEGETEFLYQKLRVNPEKGMIMIWPPGFTHTHRGNPPYTTTKYIATGWYSYLPTGGMIIMDDNGQAEFNPETHPELKDVPITVQHD